MINNRVYFGDFRSRALGWVFAAVLAGIGGSAAAGQDDDFVAARDAFVAGNGPRFEKHAAKLDGYVLEPYVEYYRLRMRLEHASAGDIRGFLDRHADTPVSDRLRSEWLKSLARMGEWGAFPAEYPKVVETDDELTCFALQARRRAGDSAALAEARPLWSSGRDLPDACDPLMDALVADGLIGEDDVWARIRLALEAGKVTVARRTAEYLPPGKALPSAELAAANDNPRRFLERKNLDLETRAGREMALFSLLKMAKSSPAQAYFQYSRLEGNFTDAERAYVLGHVGQYGTRRQDAAALQWFKEAGTAGLTPTQLEWRTRAALRAGDWDEVLASVQAMSEADSEVPAWRYWRGRALKAQGRVAEANAVLAPLSTEHHYYGLLALEELGAVFDVPPIGYKPDSTDVQKVAQLPGIQRSLALHRLGMRLEGKREWEWAIRGFDDQRLLAVAELARRNQLYDRAIATAEKTVQTHDFDLRYLAPYRDVMKTYTERLDLDEAYVYALIRQESRFDADARSSAGARGLMQLMPGTARWTAKKMGVRGFSTSKTTEVETNLALGTYYLRYVLDLFDDQPVLAAAAYNAGPGRARQWREARPMEGAVYAETIPFTETRLYVKKVMGNAAYYAAAFNQPFRSLKQRLGTVQPPAGAEKEVEKED
jgi:soluble lytic murein transglycosylase